MVRLTRWSPIEEVSFLRDQINRMFEQPYSRNGEDGQLTYNLRAEVTESPAAYTVRLLVPGIDPKEIKLQANQNELSVSYELKPREVSQDETVHVSQFRYGNFSKQLEFPQAIDTENVDAAYEHGILTITLPKAENNQRKQIEIKVKE